MIKRTIIALVTMVLLASASFAEMGDLGLLASLTSFGAGGLRVDLGGGFVADGALGYVDDGTGTETNELGFWADLYYGPWGVYVTRTGDADPSFSFMYAIEQSLGDNVVLGIATDIATMAPDTALQFFSTWDAYLVLGI